MTYVLLGFLCLRALTQYDILKALRTRVSPFYQPSLGSIQTTLKKLLSAGWVSVEMGQGRRRKNIYSITDAGREAFSVWMLADMHDEHISKLDAEISTKLFFLGLLAPPDSKRIVSAMIDFLGELLAEYRQADDAYRQVSYPASFEDVAWFQLQTLSMGIHQLSSMLDYLRILHRELEEKYD